MEKHFPFTETPENSVSALGEINLIARIREAFQKISPPAPRGIGDDCAVLPAVPERFSAEASAGTPPQRLVTTDSVIFSKHFDETVSPENAGAKLIRRNVSDIAAMGGVPADAVLALVMSGDVSAAWFERFLNGIALACVECGVELSGGDVASAPGENFFSSTLALTGFSENPLLRTGAREGDFLYATGTLGGSILKKHFDFRPRIAEGRFLASFAPKTVRACIDVTDGLLKDHAALLPAGTHAEFDFEAIPISEDAHALGGNLIQRAFCDGEDYELLIVVAGTQTDFFEKTWRENFPQTRISRIAKIVSGNENPELTQRLADARAYEHFLNEN